MDTAYLREATRPEHEATEALLPLMAADLSRAQYAAALQRVYVALAGWEAWARLHAPARLAAMVRERARLPLLEKDLAALGVERPERSLAFDLELTSEAGFLGAMYVFEGSTLGGQFIARHVAEKLGLDDVTHYFRGYGERTGSMWAAFKVELAGVPEEDTETVVAAARYAFEFFAEALRI